MRRTAFRRTAFVCLTAIALGGCGGSKQATTTVSTQGSGPASAPLPQQQPSHRHHPVPKPVSYNVTLSGAKGGAPGGSALAVITLTSDDPSTGNVCWTFSQLSNVTEPTKSRIYLSAEPATGFPLGAYAAKGCTLLGDTGFLHLLRAHPHRLYVSIASAQFPHGAVRGRL